MTEVFWSSQSLQLQISEKQTGSDHLLLEPDRWSSVQLFVFEAGVQTESIKPGLRCVNVTKVF